MQVANINAKEIHLTAVITRADGTVEELGTLDYWHKNPVKMMAWHTKKNAKSIKMKLKKLKERLIL